MISLLRVHSHFEYWMVWYSGKFKLQKQCEVKYLQCVIYWRRWKAFRFALISQESDVIAVDWMIMDYMCQSGLESFIKIKFQPGWEISSVCRFFFGFLSMLSSVAIYRPVREMVQDIHQGNWHKFGTGKLEELCKLLPDRSEVCNSSTTLDFIFDCTCSALMPGVQNPSQRIGQLSCISLSCGMYAQVKQLQSFSGNLSVLPEADQFMVQLVKVPG